MKKKYVFSVATSVVGSEYKEVVEVEFDDDATEGEIDEAVEEVYKDWLNENTFQSFEEI